MTTSPRDRAAAVAEKVLAGHWFKVFDTRSPRDVGCECGWRQHEDHNNRRQHAAHLAAALADALVAEGLVGDGEP